ncbi:MAG: alanine--tRNA ligase [Patescibacteria group bacterium]
MGIDELRKSFTNFFQQKKYALVPPAPIVPDNDPSVLFTTAGMQQFKPFYSQPELIKNHAVVSVQPVVRTTDIVEVGDATHLTMFEMLGNFRFGLHDSYKMKEQAIDEAWEFVSEHLNVAKNRIHVTVFEGDKDTPADLESEKIWQKHGVKVVKAGREDNFWGPTGDQGPCGPNTEIYIDGIEVWNLVFNQYYCSDDQQYTQLEFVGLDTGSGLARLSTVLQGKKSVWEIAPYSDWIGAIDEQDQYESKVIADHLKAVIFLVSAGVTPGNKGRDYVLRRLIRKVAFLSRKLSEHLDWLGIINKIHHYYSQYYEMLSTKEIWRVVDTERALFEKNLSRAANHLEQWQKRNQSADQKTVTELAFYMYESFGFPKEMVIEHLVSEGYEVNPKYFDELFTKHQQISRSGSAGQFKGGLADHNEQTVKHHTAHHLLLAALRQVLGPEVHQRGSNVTSERLRIDFSFDRKITDDELKKVEKIVNDQIKANLPVVREEMLQKDALKSGALAEFGQKYGDMVAVYSIGDFSKELCGGPHVKSTGELGKFEILKEEASSQGIRRIKATVG